MSGILDDIDKQADKIKANAAMKKQQEAAKKAQQEAEKLRRQNEHKDPYSVA